MKNQFCYRNSRKLHDGMVLVFRTFVYLCYFLFLFWFLFLLMYFTFSFIMWISFSPFGSLWYSMVHRVTFCVLHISTFYIYCEWSFAKHRQLNVIRKNLCTKFHIYKCFSFPPPYEKNMTDTSRQVVAWK